MTDTALPAWGEPAIPHTVAFPSANGDRPAAVNVYDDGSLLGDGARLWIAVDGAEAILGGPAHRPPTHAFDKASRRVASEPLTAEERAALAERPHGAGIVPVVLASALLAAARTDAPARADALAAWLHGPVGAAVDFSRRHCAAVLRAYLEVDGAQRSDPVKKRPSAARR